MTYRQVKDTRALNARKALRAAPISMGRGETPVELRQQPSDQPSYLVYSSLLKETFFISFSMYRISAKGRYIMTCEKQVQIKDKYCLTIDEAAEYFNIGEKKLRKIVADYLGSGFVIQNGVKVLIKRKRFEEFLEDLTAL